MNEGKAGGLPLSLFTFKRKIVDFNCVLMWRRVCFSFDTNFMKIRIKQVLKHQDLFLVVYIMQ